MSETKYVYRGVPMKSPAYAAALEGRVFPGDTDGTITPELHNEGEYLRNSPYTSFTHSYDIAKNFALRDGPGGVILRFPVGAPQSGEKWFWEFSPDGYHEFEILLHGERSGASVVFV